MPEALRPFDDPLLTQLSEEEQRLEAAVRSLDLAQSGLRDIDLTLTLAAVRLKAAIRLIDVTEPGRSEPEAAAGLRRARGLARAALQALEQLRAANVSEEQKDEVFQGEAYAELKALLQEFMLRGGGALLQHDEADGRRRDAVARAVAGALRKIGGSDGDYQAVYRTEALPGLLRRLVNVLLPILAPEGQQDPPHGVSPGQETVGQAQKMKMPLSQAIYYLEHEVVPGIEAALAASPGDGALIRRLRLTQERLREYRSITVRPRATPINLEQGFYTDWLTQYTTNGELLVSIDLPVRWNSGNNLGRLRELMQQEVVRRLAGRGICEALDRDYRYRRSLTSGTRGSSRVPSQKLDFTAGWSELRTLCPALTRLEDDRELRRMLEAVRGAGRKGGERAVRALLAGDPGELLSLP